MLSSPGAVPTVSRLAEAVARPQQLSAPGLTREVFQTEFALNQSAIIFFIRRFHSLVSGT